MTYAPEHFVAWTEIPVSNLEAGIAFYSAITGGAMEKQTMGPNETAIFTTNPPMAGVAGHLYEGKPAADGQGPTIHLMVEGTLEEAMARVAPAGGQVLSPAIEIPAGRFVYIQDPDGNSVGLFTPAGR